nr:hypothetical protein [Tanacetum cinerariifolium]
MKDFVLKCSLLAVRALKASKQPDRSQSEVYYLTKGRVSGIRVSKQIRCSDRAVSVNAKIFCSHHFSLLSLTKTLFGNTRAMDCERKQLKVTTRGSQVKARPKEMSLQTLELQLVPIDTEGKTYVMDALDAT